MANALENLIADTLVRGRVEGVAVGKAEGIAEGMASGRREAILGPLPDGLRAEIALVADGPTLGQLLVAASAANSLEEFRSALLIPNA